MILFPVSEVNFDQIVPANKYNLRWCLTDEYYNELAGSEWTPSINPSWTAAWKSFNHVCKKVIIFCQDGCTSKVLAEFFPHEIGKISYAMSVYTHGVTDRQTRVMTGITVHLINDKLVNCFRDGSILIENIPKE